MEHPDGGVLRGTRLQAGRLGARRPEDQGEVVREAHVRRRGDHTHRLPQGGPKQRHRGGEGGREVVPPHSEVKEDWRGAHGRQRGA